MVEDEHLKIERDAGKHWLGDISCMHLELGTKRIACNIWHKTSQCRIKYGEKWERLVKRMMREMKGGKKMTKQKTR